MNDCRFVIPSYKRSETVRDKTLSVLTKYNVDPNKVTIFVANEEELADYKRSLQNTPYKNFAVGQVGIGAIRNFMRDWCDQGEFCVHMDDDLMRIMKKIDDKTMNDIDDIYEDVVNPMWKAMQEHDTKLCGIYAAANPFFMKQRSSKGLYYCIGSLWGTINDKHPDRYVKLDDKEDYERTLQHYVLDGGVSRLDNITVKSKYYTEPGGMQVERTQERIDWSADNLVERFPDLCTKYIRKTTGHAELRLKDSTKGKYEKPVENNVEELLFG
tara:strand:+ start:57 stop:866 length:810 start_codon:yes stop_codon:yes gene_type:complete